VTLKPFAPYFVSGSGQHLRTADDKTVLDFLGNATSLIHGHAHPIIVQAAKEQLERGSAWSGPNARAIELAEIIHERVPSMERIRFTNSGSEATAMMVKVARAFTGRDVIMKMDATYHGCVDLFEFGPGVAPSSPPKAYTAGVPANLADNVIIAKWNDTDGVVRAIEQNAERLAAVVLTPLVSAGWVEPNPGFLEAIRKATAAHGVLLLFDEVICFRIGYGGAQGRYSVKPDLTALAKVIGGGFPVGAFGGREDVMRLTDPASGPVVAHAGTFNGNPVTSAAGVASMTLLTRDAFARLDALGERMRVQLRDVIQELGAPFRITGVASLAGMEYEPPDDDPEFASLASRIVPSLQVSYLNHGMHAKLFAAMTVMTERDVDAAASIVSNVLDELLEFVPQVRVRTRTGV